MQLTLRALLTWILPPALLVALAGAWPAWRDGGAQGLACELAAGAIVLAVMIAGGAWIIRRAARDGISRAAYLHVVLGMARPIGCVVLAAAAWKGLLLPPRPLALWLVIFYAVVFVAELFWMLRALRQSAGSLTKPPQPADKNLTSGAAVKGSDVGR